LKIQSSEPSYLIARKTIQIISDKKNKKIVHKFNGLIDSDLPYPMLAVLTAK
jgi:hypothetical protein